MFPGKILGGKNSMQVARNGHHYALKSWAQWRNRMVATIKMQLPLDWQPITVPVTMPVTVPVPKPFPVPGPTPVTGRVTPEAGPAKPATKQKRTPPK